MSNAYDSELIVVDDEWALRQMLRAQLEAEGYRIREAADGQELRRVLKDRPCSLVLLDISLPGECGLEIARHLRREHNMGIIMLTGAATLADRVLGLDTGADDYVTKPFDGAELAARIRAVLHRRAVLPHGRGCVPFGPYAVDLQRLSIFDATGGKIELMPSEVDLIAAFALNPGRVLSRDDLLRLAPARGDLPFDRSIDSRITRLRRKLEANPRQPRLIQTVRVAGYIHAPLHRLE